MATDGRLQSLKQLEKPQTMVLKLFSKTPIRNVVVKGNCRQADGLLIKDGRAFEGQLAQITHSSIVAQYGKILVGTIVIVQFRHCENQKTQLDYKAF